VFHPSDPDTGLPLTLDQLADPGQVVLRFDDREFTVADLLAMAPPPCEGPALAWRNASETLARARQDGAVPARRLDELADKAERARQRYRRNHAVRDGAWLVRQVSQWARHHERLCAGFDGDPPKERRNAGAR